MQKLSEKFITIHTENPQARLIERVVNVIKKDGVIAYPTDSGYALGCDISSKKAYDRIRSIRKVDKHHNFTLMLADLSNIGNYARVTNSHFRLLKQLLPGGYTFILPSTHLTPHRLLQPKRKTIGIRVSEHRIVDSILNALNNPMMSVSLILDEHIIYDADDVHNALIHQVDIIINGGYCPPQPTTVIDLSNDIPKLIRKGSGPSDLFAD